MLTSKQRAKLRGMANSIPALYQIGKDGITENMVKQFDDAQFARHWLNYDKKFRTFYFFCSVLFCCTLEVTDLATLAHLEATFVKCSPYYRSLENIYKSG